MHDAHRHADMARDAAQAETSDSCSPMLLVQRLTTVMSVCHTVLLTIFNNAHTQRRM